MQWVWELGASAVQWQLWQLMQMMQLMQLMQLVDADVGAVGGVLQLAFSARGTCLARARH